MAPNDIERLQKECDFEYMKAEIEKQQTKIKLLNDIINEYKERMDKARRILEE